MKRIMLILVTLSSYLSAVNINITQVDTSKLVLNQNINIYAQITDDNGEHIPGYKIDNIRINEYSDNTIVDELYISAVQEGINSVGGVNFILLIDNSGSMYRTIDGKLTNVANEMRISIAKDAVKEFITNKKNVKDKIFLASFNTELDLITQELDGENLDILNKITVPLPGNKTELYTSLVESLEFFKEISGRKVIVVLSDGENVYAEDNDKRVGYLDVIENFLKNGVTLFGINFAGEADSNLISICNQTGGYILNAFNQSDLMNIYSKINKQIQTEYLITYRASMFPSLKKGVELVINDNKSQIRTYYSSTVFGVPKDKLTPIIFLLPFLSIILIFIIWNINFQKANISPNIEILEKAPGVSVNCSTIVLGNNETIIGGNDSADLTIVGGESVSKDYAKIEYNKELKNYTVISKEAIIVNNKKTQKKILEPGDVINIDGTLVLFDDQKK